MGRPRKKLEDFRQLDGKLDHPVPDGVEVIEGQIEPTNAPRIRSLDELTGFHQAKYITHDEESYAASLKEMNSVDLERECVRVGLLPNGNRIIMAERLLKVFRQYTSPFLTAHEVKPIQLKPTKEGMEILSQGANKAR